MPRKKPFSAKQRKVQLQEARAIQRGDLQPNSATSTKNRKPGVKSRFQKSALPTFASETTRRLQSRFIQVSPEYLARTRDLASSVPLERPIPSENAVFDLDLVERGNELTCPTRPKFRYDQTKKELEKNEEGWFAKWLKVTEGVMREYVEGGSGVSGSNGKEREGMDREDEDAENRGETVEWPRSGSWYETNLEVWRQLWRVSEASQILLLLLDSRCPPLHSPPSLRAYVQGLKPRKEVILVLTKADLVDPSALEGWKAWIRDWWGPDVQVVSVMSYDLDLLRAGRSRHRPEIPRESLEDLVKALQRAHAKLSQPHPRTRADPEKLKKWRSPVRTKLDWSLLLPKGAAPILSREQVERDQVNQPNESESVKDGDVNGDGDEERDPEKEPLTIGLIGQPNVGKSSLLNALLGEQRVRASRTPGKTKHFQTMFWGWKKEVKIVDCPGLVCPSLVGLELQALAGVLPISQIPSMPACIHYAATLLPLEIVFRVPKPEPTETDAYAAKKTWRGDRPAQEQEKKEVWTASDIMEGRALDRGFLTAKGGRPDGNRAANGMMRFLADGKIRWGFWPPGSQQDRSGSGIWLGEDDGVIDGGEGEDAQSEAEDEMLSVTESDDDAHDQVNGKTDNEDQDEDEDERDNDGSHDDEDDDDGEEEESEDRPAEATGFFAALAVDDGDDEDDEE